MSLHHPNHPNSESWLRSLGAVVAGLALLFFVVLMVLVYINRLMQGEVNPDQNLARASDLAQQQDGSMNNAADSDEEVSEDRSDDSDAGGMSAQSVQDSADAVPQERIGQAGPTETAAAGPLPTSADALGGQQVYKDPVYGFQTTIPANWRRGTVSGSDQPLTEADHDVIWENSVSGARMAISVWNAGGLPPINIWMMDAARGMGSVDARWPDNGTVAGQPASVLWAPETPTTPARYAVFFSYGGRYYRVAYTADDGGAAVADFATALVHLSWPDDVQTMSAPDLIPPLPNPEARYHPGAIVFEAGGA